MVIFLKPWPGVDAILAIMLDYGSKNLSKEKLSEITDINNIKINPDVDVDNIIVRSSCQNANIAQTIGLIREILFNPDLSQEKFNKAKERLRIELLSRPKDASSRAIEELYPDHPYGHSPRKVLEDLDKITLQDVVDFYNNIMQNAQARVVVTGPVSGSKNSPDARRNLVDSLQSNMPIFNRFSYIMPSWAPDLADTKVITEVDDRDQAHIVQMFKITPTGNIKDEATIKLLNQILGGSGEARLFQDLREKKKLAYTVGSHYFTNGLSGELVLHIKTTTRTESGKQLNDNLPKSIEGFKEHINALVATPVRQEELEAAKLALKT